MDDVTVYKKAKVGGDVEYHMPDDAITPELLEDGSFLKCAIEICNRNRIQLNIIKFLFKFSTCIACIHLYGLLVFYAGDTGSVPGKMAH